MVLGAAQKGPRHGGQIQPAHGGQYPHRVGGVGAMQGQRPVDDLFFLFKGRIRQPAAPAGDGLRRGVGQGCQHRRRGGGVADAHFPDAQRLYAVRRGLCRQLHAGFQRLKSLLPGHGGFSGDVAGGAAHLPVQHAGDGAIRVDAHVRHHHLVAEVVGQRRHPRLVAGHVDDLRKSHGGGGGGDALRRDAIIRRQHQHPALLDMGAHLSGDARQPDGVVLQFAQTAGGLGQLRLTAAGGVHDLPIRDGDGLAVLLQFLICHRLLLTKIALLRQPCKGRGAVLIFDGPCGRRTLLQQRRQYLLHGDAAFSQTAVEIPIP